MYITITFKKKFSGPKFRSNDLALSVVEKIKRNTSLQMESKINSCKKRGHVYFVDMAIDKLKISLSLSKSPQGGP